MEYVIAAIIIAVLIWWANIRSAKPGRTNANRGAAAVRQATADDAWLRGRWKLAEEEKKAGDLKVIPSWFFDPVTDAQIKKLESLDVPGRHKRLTKGQASDLIGMHYPAEDYEIEQLKFLKISTRGINQTRARHELAVLNQDQANVAAWENRPANASDKDMARFVGIKLPAKVTHVEANKILGEFWTNLPDDDPLHDEWDAYEEMWDELSDPDNREMFGVKKISLSLYRTAVEELRKEGKTIRELSEDLDILFEKLVELNPDVRRS